MLLPLPTLTWTILLLTLNLPFLCTAAENIPNVTIVFFPTDNKDCALRNEVSNLTFSTAFYPDPGIGFSIDLVDVFTGTGNVRRARAILGDGGGGVHPVASYLNVSFAVLGRENWNPMVNYSNVLYTQLDFHNQYTSDDEAYYAQRDVSLYGDPDSLGAYTSNCRSRGNCQELPIAIRGLNIYRPAEDDGIGPNPRNKKDQCVLAAAETGLAVRIRPWLLGSALVALAVAWPLWQ